MYTRSQSIIIIIITLFLPKIQQQGTPHFLCAENNLILVKRSDWLGYLLNLRAT